MINKLTYLFLFFSFGLFGQSAQETLSRLEDSLVDNMKIVRAEKDRTKQIKLNNHFEELLRRTLRYDEAFTYKFEKLGKFMSTVASPDGAFRLFNWNLEIGEYQEQKFHCLIMKKIPKTDNFIIIELWDKSADAPYKIEYVQFTEKKWFGALYYKIIPVTKGGSTIYTLLGWDGNNMISNKKIIETMQFYKQDKVKFGFPIFRSETDKNKRRVIFTYKKESSMSLRENNTKKQTRIVFDHLAPTNPAIDVQDMYAADGSYDAYYLQGWKWMYIADVDARSNQKFKTKYKTPRKVKLDNVEPED
ncbi:MAG: hypothetical protein ACI9N1_001163 [Flavobacteriales bacterium]|jgi:hypothetical protein